MQDDSRDRAMENAWDGCENSSGRPGEAGDAGNARSAGAPRSARKKRRGKQRYPLPLASPVLSSCLYVRLAPADVAMFRFLLEAEDNLAYMSTVDRWSSVLKVTCSPHQEEALRAYLETMRDRISFTILHASSPASHGVTV